MIEEVKLLYAPFRNFISGHVCLIFRFADGREVVISPEAQTDKFIPLLGFTPLYRLKYRQLEYSEYIKRYQETSRHFQIVTLDIESGTACMVYDHMVRRVSYLEYRTERYHILFNSCVTNVYRHLSKIENNSFGLIKKIQLLFNPLLFVVLVRTRASETGVDRN